ncbi:helix-turn-helix domain-containing protein [Micromonospora sp. AKA38]|uniref:helix-turn-helix domain-containing protein n=1 Tax=Micromonospora sp. AKA38 TaxID=2733861 RepID=UPI0035B54E6B
MLWQRLRAPAETSGRGAVPSLRAVAARSGYSVGFLSEVLRGRKRPSPDAAAAIAEALGGTEYDVNAARTYAERMRDSPVPRPPRPVPGSTAPGSRTGRVASVSYPTPPTAGSAGRSAASWPLTTRVRPTPNRRRS